MSFFADSGGLTKGRLDLEVTSPSAPSLVGATIGCEYHTKL